VPCHERCTPHAQQSGPFERSQRHAVTAEDVRKRVVYVQSVTKPALLPASMYMDEYYVKTAVILGHTFLVARSMPK
jgi:hypothetical protein